MFGKLPSSYIHCSSTRTKSASMAYSTDLNVLAFAHYEKKYEIEPHGAGAYQ